MAAENHDALSARIEELEARLLETSEQYEGRIKKLKNRVRGLIDERDYAHNQAQSNLLRLENIQEDLTHSQNITHIMENQLEELHNQKEALIAERDHALQLVESQQQELAVAEYNLGNAHDVIHELEEELEGMQNNNGQPAPPDQQAQNPPPEAESEGSHNMSDVEDVDPPISMVAASEVESHAPPPSGSMPPRPRGRLSPEDQRLADAVRAAVEQQGYKVGPYYPAED